MRFKNFLTSLICLHVIGATLAFAEEPFFAGRIIVDLPAPARRTIQLTSCSGSIVYKHPSSKLALTYRFKKGKLPTLSNIKIPKEIIETEGEAIAKTLSVSKFALNYSELYVDIDMSESTPRAGFHIESSTAPKGFKLKKRRFEVETNVEMRLEDLSAGDGNTSIKYKEKNNKASIKVRSKLSASEFFRSFQMDGDFHEIVPSAEEGGEPIVNSIGGFSSGHLTNSNFQLTTTLNCNLPTE